MSNATATTTSTAWPAPRKPSRTRSSTAHGDLYRRAANGRARLHIEAGAVSLRSIATDDRSRHRRHAGVGGDGAEPDTAE
jgi:hypothetical protein